MRVIPTRIHGLLDYGLGVLLIAAPWLLGFHDDSDAARLIPLVLGIAVIVYSLLTRYELGVVRLLPMPVHLAIDVLGGLVLAASPWLFGFADRVWLPHLILGLLEIGAALTTQTVPDREEVGARA